VSAIPLCRSCTSMMIFTGGVFDRAIAAFLDHCRGGSGQEP
jgi:hypothetical protein